jgi:hypothetical protein
LVKDVKPETTENTKQHMKNAFPGEEWAEREPMVLRGTSATGDNYWKGMYDHKNAVLLAETYGCPDPYAVTEMEDVAVSNEIMWTANELRAAIDRCEREAERRIQAHEPPERVYGARQGIETLYRMLEEAEAHGQEPEQRRN